MTSLQDAIDTAGGALALLRGSRTPPSVVPRVPAEYTNWYSEQVSSRETCALFDQSHHMNNLSLKGPGAAAFLERLAVNDFRTFPVGRAKQLVVCNDDGHVIGEAIAFRLDDEEFLVVGIVPMMNYLEYRLEAGGDDVVADRDENSLNRAGDPQRYRYQLQGPRALDIMREILGGEPPALRFFHFGEVRIAGRTVTAFRHGMAGEPGYELFGPWEDDDAILGAILDAGRKHGLVRVGGAAYHSNALESGYLPRPLPAIYDHPELAGYRAWLSDRSYEATAPLGGSLVSDDIADYYFTPYDLGYARLVSFDHDFVGRAALQRIADEGRAAERVKVSLVWNGEDVERAIGTMFGPAPGAKVFRFPMSLYATFQYDAVRVGGRTIGSATWTGYLAPERAVVSVAVVDAAFAEPGTRVEVVWGEDPVSSRPQVEPHRQITLRATVAPSPLGDYARTRYRTDAV